MADEQSDMLRPDRYRNYLMVLARTMVRASGPVGRKANASDLVQETLLQAHVALPKFRGATEAELEAWLRKILTNKLADAARHAGRQKRDAALEQSYRETVNASAERFQRLAADQTSPSQYALRHERAIRLADALSALPEDQRQVVESHHLGGDSVAEIAEEMDRSKASVAGLLRRGLDGLREHLRDLE